MMASMHRGLAWLLALPAMTAGSLGAHELAYRAAEPDPAARAGTLAASGHEYLPALPFVLGAAAAFLLAGLALVARRALAGAEPVRPPAWPIALVPLAGFAAQEHFERLAAGAPLDVITEPAFLAGLGLQVPLALLALAAARWVGRAVETAARHLAAARPGLRRRHRRTRGRPGVARVHRVALGSLHAGRGPPLPA
jgi:hypothetical protein